MLKFKTTEIPGSTESLVPGSPEIMLRRGRYWEVVGEFEIAGKKGGRDIIVRHLLHDQYEQPEDLDAVLDELDDLVGQHGKLEYTTEVHGDPREQVFHKVTFEHFERIPLEGQAQAMPLKDIAGTLFDDDGEPDEGWFILVCLYFRQLTLE